MKKLLSLALVLVLLLGLLPGMSFAVYDAAGNSYTNGDGVTFWFEGTTELTLIGVAPGPAADIENYDLVIPGTVEGRTVRSA